jgi:large subunit ribosomal protein L23
MESISLKEETKRSSRDIIKRPVITEKSVEDASYNKYTFEVDGKANKVEIRKAVEDIFKVKVTKITTEKIKGKRKIRFDKKGRHAGYSSDWKKARVTLKEGDKIEISGFNPFEI